MEYPTNEKEALEALRGADPELAATAEALLWRTWCRSGNPDVDRLMLQGIEAMQQHRLAKAEELFDRIINRAPDFAEGWNKRATVRYLRKNFNESVADCQQNADRPPLMIAVTSLPESELRGLQASTRLSDPWSRIQVS